jgi:hypothetical protein
MITETSDSHRSVMALQNNARGIMLMDNEEASEQKHRIYAELTAYRKKHGLGCFKDISDATDGKVAISTIANMFTGIKVKLDIWLLVGEALKKLMK